MGGAHSTIKVILGLLSWSSARGDWHGEKHSGSAAYSDLTLTTRPSGSMRNTTGQKGIRAMKVSDVVVSLDWSPECHGIKVRWPDGEAILLSDYEIGDGNDFYPKPADATEKELAEAESRMDIISALEVSSMLVEDGYLVISLNSDVDAALHEATS